mmetsp:Transcript_39193/g.100410  ORF Transcript_39193/g.100410 Transcript_39193/m.100410 type:complete len:303 (-) Transcript_39193:45-953(-)
MYVMVWRKEVRGGDEGEVEVNVRDDEEGGGVQSEGEVEAGSRRLAVSALSKARKSMHACSSPIFFYFFWACLPLLSGTTEVAFSLVVTVSPPIQQMNALQVLGMDTIELCCDAHPSLCANRLGEVGAQYREEHCFPSIAPSLGALPLPLLPPSPSSTNMSVLSFCSTLPLNCTTAEASAALLSFFGPPWLVDCVMQAELLDVLLPFFAVAAVGVQNIVAAFALRRLYSAFSTASAHTSSVRELRHSLNAFEFKRRITTAKSFKAACTCEGGKNREERKERGGDDMLCLMCGHTCDEMQPIEK